MEGRIGTAVNYHCSYVSLKNFRGNVRFADITTAYLIAYEHQLKARNLSKSTIGIYLRPLRAIYNEAAEAGYAKKDKCYPFGRRKYQIPAARRVKKALELSDIEALPKEWLITPKFHFFRSTQENNGLSDSNRDNNRN